MEGCLCVMVERGMERGIRDGSADTSRSRIYDLVAAPDGTLVIAFLGRASAWNPNKYALRGHLQSLAPEVLSPRRKAGEARG